MRVSSLAATVAAAALPWVLRASGAGAGAAEQRAPTWAEADDECADGSGAGEGGSCGLSALQLRGQKKAAEATGATEGDSGAHGELITDGVERWNIRHYAQPCWKTCGEGMCEDFCGPRNACCKSSWRNTPECNAVSWWPTTAYFTCVNTNYAATTTTRATPEPGADDEEEEPPEEGAPPEAAASTTTTTSPWPEEGCHTAVEGEACYNETRAIMTAGFFESPSDYPGVTLTSPFEVFQLAAHRKDPAKCPMPCRPPEVQCQTAAYGSECYRAAEWARNEGIFGNPEWYPELQANSSSIQEFQAHIHLVSPGECPVPCLPTYARYSRPTYLTSRARMKGVAYGPAPLKRVGQPLLNDDFMSDVAGAMWSDLGRGDMTIISDLGANTMRLYGNDEETPHRTFFDEALAKGMDVIVGISDWPYMQMPGNCMSKQWDCYDQIYESYTMNLLRGFTVSNSTYHPALKALILLNEPDLKVHPRSMTCKALLSAMDAVLQAEQDAGVTENPVALTATFSFGAFDGQPPGLGQMEDFYTCIKNPSSSGYTPKNDLHEAYKKRWVNSFNTANPGDSVKDLLLDKYGRQFWTEDVKIPVFIGEYHSVYVNVKKDMQEIVAAIRSTTYPFFMGLNFFEFSRRYDKGGSEMAFGMFGYGDCALSNMNTTGGVYNIWDLTEIMDKDGEPMPRSVAAAYGGKPQVTMKDGPCVTPAVS